MRKTYISEDEHTRMVIRWNSVLNMVLFSTLVGIIGFVSQTLILQIYWILFGMMSLVFAYLVSNKEKEVTISK